ncbi:cAMP-dependent protein kinase catalytic subunit [Eumeta japonica]|uniref:cAMP-dependent protein kinase catalytic subunit n=1 Tax=Eumeta variegata TaxID=151549 RepID=A0A4C1SYB5_EUMVA|nr:cAMP-dependent protein kinase catalytic subunit [Eumeta japonica]
MAVELEETEGFSLQQHALYSKYLDSLKAEFNKLLTNPPTYDKSVDDFDRIKLIGAGAFGNVFLVRDKITFSYHAMKVFDKNVAMEKSLVKQLLLEKKILQCIKFPFTISLDYCCKDNVYVFYILPFEIGGEFFNYMRKVETLSEPALQFYASQVVLALEYLHHLGVIHRDVKPENILLNEKGYLKLADFGLCKMLKKRTWTLCGTPEYLAPEIILSSGYNAGVDWWALGILIYEMNASFPPFYSSNPMKLYEKITDGHYKCPETMSKNCRGIVKGLLQVDNTKRLGSLKGGTYDIKSHPWFHEIKWQDILLQRLEAPYIPVCKSQGDTTNFPHLAECNLRKSKTNYGVKEFADF